MILQKLKIGFLFMIILFLLTGCTDTTAHELKAVAVPNEETSKQMERFNQLGEMIYNHTLQGNFTEARKQMNEMGNLIPGMRLDGITTLLGVRALADTLLQGNREFNAVQMKPEALLFASTRIRLMADALVHPNTPLWLQYNKVIQEDLRVMEQGAKQKEGNELKKAFTDLKSHYQTILPALQVSLQEEEITKIDSVFHYMQKELNYASISYPDVNRALKTLKEQWDTLFQLKPETTVLLPFIESNDPVLIWMGWMGSIIFLILAFAAWRMRQARDSIITVKR
jgi:sporulation protein YpjB